MKPLKDARWVTLARTLSMLVLLSSTTSTGSTSAIAQENRSSEAQRADDANRRPPRTYRSRNFIVHTDLADNDAELLLKRLEEKLLAIADYWGRRSQGTIECYVADDLSNWPDSALPHPFARLIITRIGGATTEFVEMKGRQRIRRTVVIASARPGIAEHEIVHAYCLQTFGATGPVWYKEGMADLAYLSRDGESGVRCPAEYVDFFRASKFQTVRDTVQSGGFTRGISDSLNDIAANSAVGKDRDVRALLAAWTKKDTEEVVLARESYRWSWALCYLLCHNSNYADRFHALGQSFLTNRGDSFDQAFAPVRQEIDFEYEFFMERFDVGFDVDRCRWDWSKPFYAPTSRRNFSAEVVAQRGYQASGVLVASGSRYTYRTTGTWTTKSGETATNANGTREGRGRMVGAVMNDFVLSEPFDLGTDGSFTAPSDGKLYLRCQDAWNELADNQGSLTVKIQLDNRKVSRRD